MQVPNESTIFIIPDDGTPQAYLSNYPSPLTVNYAYVFAWCFQILATVLGVWLFIQFRKYRKLFPCNLLPTNMHSGMILGQPFVVLAYTHYYIIPDLIPCWLHCVFMFFPFLFFGWMGTASNLRNYVMYTAQGLLAKGNYSGRIIKLRNMIRSSNRFEFTVACLYFSLTALPHLIRLSTIPQEILLGPMWDLRCTSFSIPVFTVFTSISFITIFANVASSHLSKNVKESYPFRHRYKAVSKWVGRGIFFSQLPHYVKQFATGIDPTIYNHISWISINIWACCYSFPFLLHLAYKVIRDARLARMPSSETSSKTSSSSKKSSSSRTLAAKVSPDDAFLAGLLQNASNIAELKSMLTQSDQIINKAFSEYLQRELCVESILFANDVRNFIQRTADSETGKKAALDIAEKYLLVGSACEVNVSDTLRGATLKQLETTLNLRSITRVGAAQDVAALTGPYPQKNVFSECDDELHRIMLDPFQRFVRKHKMQQQ